MDINQVSKQYGTKKVVENVDYQVTKGKLTAFIGPNGAGKSTLLHLLGINHERLSYYHNGIERRLTDVHGHVISDVLG